MTLLVAGVSFKRTPVAIREQLAVKPSQLVDTARRLKICGELDEIVLLSTCNRVEIYSVTKQPSGCVERLLRLLNDGQHDSGSDVYVYENAEAACHLFRVVGGLDSMVLGETEITGQVKNAYESARVAQLTGRVLNRTFQSAFHASKKIRHRTGIGRGATSVGSAAVELAGKIFGHDLARRKVMIIGAGQMGETCVRHFARKGVKAICVSNRSFDRAVKLAKEFEGQAIHLDGFLCALGQVDIVVSATGCPNTLLHRADMEMVSRKQKHRPFVLIDISVPRNIDADIHGLHNVYLYNIDDLDAIVRENVQTRENDLAKCEQIIVPQVATLMAKLNLEIGKLDDTAAEDLTRPSVAGLFNPSVPKLCYGLPTGNDCGSRQLSRVKG
jgi:glutamyl-tRNA reductase